MLRKNIAILSLLSLTFVAVSAFAMNFDKRIKMYKKRHKDCIGELNNTNLSNEEKRKSVFLLCVTLKINIENDTIGYYCEEKAMKCYKLLDSTALAKNFYDEVIEIINKKYTPNEAKKYIEDLKRIEKLKKFLQGQMYCFHISKSFNSNNIGNYKKLEHISKSFNSNNIGNYKKLEHRNYQEMFLRELKVGLRDFQRRNNIDSRPVYFCDTTSGNIIKTNINDIVDMSSKLKKVRNIFNKLGFHQVCCKICGDKSDDKGNLYREKVYRVIDKSVVNKKDANSFQEVYQKVCSDLRFNCNK